MKFVKTNKTEEQIGVDDNLIIDGNVGVKTDFNHEIRSNTLIIFWNLLVDDNLGNIAYIKTNYSYEIKNKETKHEKNRLIEILNETYAKSHERCEFENFTSSRYISISSSLNHDLIQQILPLLEKSLSQLTCHP